MTHLKLVEPSASPKPPRAMRRVRAILADVMKLSEERRFIECIVLTLEKDGAVGISFTGADSTRIMGMLEIAKHHVLEDTSPVDIE